MKEVTRVLRKERKKKKRKRRGGRRRVLLKGRMEALIRVRS